MTDGASQTGGGIKRSTTLPIDSIYDSYYAHSYADSGSGVCFGDSGGPGLYEIEGEWRVIGVNSAGDSEGYDPCKQGYSIHTRVDAYADWITELVTGESPDCADNPDMCLCAEACTADGSCDDTLCGDLDCAALNNCLGQCDESDTDCYDACYALATSEAAAYIEDLFSCLYNHCNGLTGDGYQSCASVNCSAEIGACYTTETGEAQCEVLADCAADCDTGDNTCVASCMKSGTADAQILARAVVECWSGQCASYAQRSTDWIDCITANCAGTVDACAELSLCDPLGGDCAAGQACAPTIFGDTDCVASGGGSLGAVCDPTVSLPQPCVDGLECIAFGDSGICARRCITASDCPDGVTCQRPYFEDVEDYGICLCTDNDHDGWCLEGTTPDCDDAQDAASPGLTERCGDDIDNDCDGSVDEDCEGCVDADEDGYCAEVDCDDTNDAVHPDGTDLCGDGIDGDCDGVVDGDCVDADGDGFDEGVDCDDTQRWVNPDALERCGDEIDNDCDGDVDEGCEDCVDVDEDGFCADVDCDDTNSAVRPNTIDLCGDDFDGNCDGVIDDGCESEGGAEEEPGATSSGSGGCSTGSAAPRSTALLLALVALLGLFVLRRRVRL